MKPRRIVTTIATVATVLLVIAVAVAWSIGTNDIIMLPAPAEAIDSHIVVAGHPRPPGRGTFYITFVDEPQANLLTKLYESFNPDATIVPLAAYYGPNIPPPAQQQKQNIADMLTSKQDAQLAAFNALGQSVAGEQVAVADILPQSHAVGKLRNGDVILQVDGHTVRTPGELRQVVQRVMPGDPISLLVGRTTSRDVQTLRVTVATIRNPSTGTAAIGIQPQLTLSALPTHLPYKVTINTDNIEGPSAGLMFTLAIINRLSPVDLTHGHKIAGTGTIDAAGIVGPIGGVKQKVIGARAAGAQYFFVPAECDAYVCNYKEAKPYAQGITLVPVNTLDDALTFLRHLH